MNRFDELVRRTTVLLEADPSDMNADPSGIPSSPPQGMQGSPNISPQGPSMPDLPPGDPEVVKLSSEGRRYLVDLALKALSFDPDDISDPDKGVFDVDVTTENAEKVLKQIRSILSGTDVKSSADND
jgi:hypothetical protein